MSELEATIRIQREVGNPATSAWVSANAGTGKTYVLVRRVIRQLLAGSPPASIVCITYTKAAAAEMAERLLGMLSEWALKDDGELAKAIEEVTGETPPTSELAGARRLFAKALESPGGLKIQTIHSLCASILGRFPAEAGLAVGFVPLEEDEAQALLTEVVRDFALDAADGNHPLHDSFRSATKRFQGEAEEPGNFSGLTLERALLSYAAKTRGLRSLSIGSTDLGTVLRQATGCKDDCEMAIAEECLTRLKSDSLTREILQVFPELNATAGKLAQALADIVESDPHPDHLRFSALHTKTGTRQKQGLTKASTKIANWESRWDAYCAHIEDGQDRLKALDCYRENEHMDRLAIGVLTAYQVKKAERNALDYDDLVERTLELLTDTQFPWIQYKLDAGIEHVLLDEAQDTSPVQWELFRRLVEEIVSAEPESTGRERARTLFVVGDPKQSIYAFNGAEAALFNENREAYRAVMADHLAARELYLSFRTSQPVLSTVDAVFRNERFRAVAGGYADHVSSKPAFPGSVELWDHFPKIDKEKPPVWNRGVDAPSATSEDRRVAEAIAADIKAKLDGPPPLACREGARLQPSDVMVLFQRRGPRFRETIRTLAEAGVPCAGTDRIAINEDVAVKDLICLLRFAANRDDCFSLAVLLKSPMWGWTDEDLLALHRERGASRLWKAVREQQGRGGRLGSLADIAAPELQSLLDAGSRTGPYGLLSAALDGAPDGLTGRTRFRRRLGDGYREAADAFLEEALAFEEQEPRSIHGFLRHAEKLQREIKREVAGDETGGVRVMTVHGAKGLEAPLVYIGDADYLKRSSDVFKTNPWVTMTGEGGAVLPVLVPSSAGDRPSAISDLCAESDERRIEEYHRLLYVAMTRSAEHLVVCGGKEPKGSGPSSWHAMVGDALGEMAKDHPVQTIPLDDGRTKKRYCVEAEVAAIEDSKAEARYAAPPPWLERRAEKEAAPTVVYPSLLGDREEDVRGRIARTPASGDPRLRGILIHRLLEVLPSHDTEDWVEVAAEILRREGRGLDDEEQKEVLAATLTVLKRTELTQLFGPGAQGEVSIQGEIGGQTISGEIDRLLVTDQKVILAEFKTTRWVPESSADIPRAHRQQTELYAQLLRRLFPSRAVQPLLVYTAGPTVFELHEER
ncbi:double-strand break repair helicase AddA [Parvularcula maris]|uniref:DNA 3'-5' helicase n=1 Tax=Parvularcula maris TaxID=2965077 RepID=A0A9X2L829_9PROT|nr:double-strand break repair helicase AddA [Parvularcula maris]MCQ8184708.1 double-strand break repair helicase AddA [Parvularcula maris]